MGTVWLAERSDGTLKRRVALKLPRLVWGAGLAERLARERDIGAMLEHPNIARLYDAGVDDKGRPYLALEYIDGQPIDAYCAAQGLDIRSRLKLFLQVAHAVAYAHGRLVVHRDLKPSNVLVSADGQVHLLDFGIAKLLDEPADGLTQRHGRLMTLLYASPEQVAGEPVTVQSDVYSLAVLLFEVLTGQMPYRPHRATLGAAEDEVLQADVVAASTKAQVPSVAHALRGDIDAILGKALSRAPEARYATVDALAQDIERYLNGETVLARPYSLGYRLRKAAARHRTAVSAAVLIALAVLGGSAASLVQGRRAAEAADRERVVKDFVLEVFKVNAPQGDTQSELRQLPVELLLDRGAQMIEQRFAGRPGLQAELYGVVAKLFVDMGAVEQGVSYASRQVSALAAADADVTHQGRAMLLLARAMLNSGRFRDAEQRAQRAQQLLQPDLELESEAEIVRASALNELGDTVLANRTLDRVFVRLGPTAAGRSLALGHAEALRADLLEAANRHDEALSHYQAAIDIGLSIEGTESQLAVETRLALAGALASRERVEEAKVQHALAVAALRKLGGAGQVRAAFSESNFWAGRYQMLQAPFAEVREVLERNRALLASTTVPVPPVIIARADRNLGQSFLLWGDIAAADRLFASSMPVLAASDSPSKQSFINLLLAWLAYQKGRHTEADRLLHDIVQKDVAQRVPGTGTSPFDAYDFIHAARSLAMQGRFDEAEALLEQAGPVQTMNGQAIRPDAYSDAVVWALARIKLDRGDVAAALALMKPFDLDQSDHLVEDRRLLVGESECRLGLHERGLARLLAAINTWTPEVYPHNPYLARARAVAAKCAFDAGNRVQARTLAALARASFDAQPNVSSYFKAPLVQVERQLR